jgi:hypothetical protein
VPYPLFPARWTPAQFTERDRLRPCDPFGLPDRGDDGAAAIIDNLYCDRSASTEAVQKNFADQMSPAIARVLNHARVK